MRMKVVMINRGWEDGSGDSAKNTVNQTRDNNTNFKSYYNLFKTITTNYNNTIH